MREILFRGKDTKGQWLLGNLLVDERENCYIGQCIMPKKKAIFSYSTSRRNEKTLNRFIGVGMGLVVSKTVGQYTGLTDKNGNKIFEGDILESRISENPEDWKIWTVGYEDGTFTFESVRKSVKSRRKYRHEMNMLCVDEVEFYGLVLVGNIHDNPDLIGGEK